MIVQTAPDGRPHFVIPQIEHARMAGVFARAFGNETFAPLLPHNQMEYVVTHHDEGWTELDEAPKRDPRTGLVYHLTQTPLADLTVTSRRSPDFNEQEHPFCGLISSMHSWGLYNGRYGLSDKIFIDSISPADRPMVDTMLQGEIDRQERLKARLRRDPKTANWTDETFLFHNYKLLQFFDTLALYFQMVHESAWVETVFHNVPMAVGQDTSITVRPAGSATVSLTPCPFAVNRLQVCCTSRYLHAQAKDVDIGAVLRDLPVEYQSFTLVAGYMWDRRW